MIKVLIADSSLKIRSAISNILKSEPGINVVATAVDGVSAIEKIKRYGPDIVMLGAKIPYIGGRNLLKAIMKDWPLPVIMIVENSETDSKHILNAMGDGAVDYIIEPESGNMSEIKKQITAIVKAISLASLRIYKKAEKQFKEEYSFESTSEKIVVIGASTGGPQTIEALITQFPKNIPAPILIVQHMPKIFTESFAKRLNQISEIEVREAKEGDKLEEGVALLAPGGFHMEIIKRQGKKPVISLNNYPKEQSVRPCANKLFRSAALIYKENTIAIVLTGMGKDCTDGAINIKKEKGTVIAESEKSSIIFGMPKEVINAGCADLVVDIDKMTVALIQLLDV